jgi:mono/diheme cytochrome c family protein
LARLIAPNVKAKLAGYTDSEFAGFLRYGVRKDGTGAIIMPPPGLYHMSDADLAALIGYIRAAPESPAPLLPTNSFGPMARFGLAIGQFKTSAREVDTAVARVGADPAHTGEREGEYMARMVCANCHGKALTGDPGTPSPSLSAAYGYSLEEFRTLLRTGTPRDPATKLTLMAEVARSDLRHFSDDELTAVYEYLKGLPIGGVKGAGAH